MRLYAAFDLHSSNSYLGIVEENGKRKFKRRLRNQTELIRETLLPFKDDIVGIVVESTYNWYWLVDFLMEEGYRVHLANPSQIKQYSGIKHSDDKDDVFWLAELLRLKILPEGYITQKSKDRLTALRRQETMCRTAGKFLQGDSATKRRRAVATGRMATSICRGHMQRQQRLHGGLMLKRGPIMTGSGGGQTHRLPTVHLHTS